jgi:uncharacterized membrane protein
MENAIERSRTGGIEVNAADVEHMGALVTGSLLLLTGLRRGGFIGSVLGAAGGALIYRGQKGYRRLYDLLGLELPMEPTGLGRYNVRAECDCVIDRSATELYRIWRNLENLPIFMNHLVSVVELDDTYSRWIARGPLGMVVKWDARVINDVEDEVIAWESLEGSGVDNAGSVRFEKLGENQTRVHVVMRYDPPAEHLGTMIAKLFGRDPELEMEQDLRRFKRILESSDPRKEDRPVQASVL